MFRCSNLGRHFLKPGGLVDSSGSPALCSKCGAAECLSEGCTEGGKWPRCKVRYGVHSNVLYSVLF